jgi:hypothetical protein
MRRALARFNASTMMSSSIRFSLVGAAGGLHHEDVAGAHVLADLDRDLAVGETAHRGLAQLDAEVRGDLLRQHRVGVAGEQHGVEQHVGFSVRQNARMRGPAVVRRCLAGEEGLEPSHVGIKIRCLDQLGDSPTQEADCSAPQTSFSRPTHQRDAGPGCGTVARPIRPEVHPASLSPRVKRLACAGSRKHGTAGARHPAVAEAGFQPPGGLRHFGHWSSAGAAGHCGRIPIPSFARVWRLRESP